MTESGQKSVKPLSELADIYPGYSPKSNERLHSGEYLSIGGRNINNGQLILTNKDAYINKTSKSSFLNAIAQPGDIIVSTLFDRRKLYIYQKSDPKAIINSSCAIVRAPQANDYIISYLRTYQGQSDFISQASKATTGNFIPRLSIHDLRHIPIPILPLSDLQLLGDAHIEATKTDELLILREELRRKDYLLQEEDVLYSNLRASTVVDKDLEIKRLSTKLSRVIDYYEDRIRKIESQISNNDIKSKIAHGETSQLEFKSSLRWNIKAKRDDPDMECGVLKTIAAFCNTEGGELLIGIADDHSIIGLEQDHFPNSDKFLLHMRNLIMNKLIPNVIPFVEYDIFTLEGKQICHVKCKKSTVDIWLKPDKTDSEIFYIRSGPASSQLRPREALRYIREHFQK